MSRSGSLTRLYTWLLASVIFLIPTNLFLKLFEESAYVHGLLVDYLLPKIYLSDLPILGILFLWLGERLLERIQRKQRSAPKKPNLFLAQHLLLFASFLFFFYFLLFRQFSSSVPISALWYLLKLIEWGGLFIFLFTHQQLFKESIVKVTFLFTLLFQSLLAIYQFFQQQSFFQSYLFLGEPNLSHRLGLAKTVIFGNEKILPYGTTAHPNILGGFLACSGLVLFSVWLHQKRPTQNTFLMAILGISSIALLFTQSLSAWLIATVGVLYVWGSYKKREWRKYLLTGGVVFFFMSPLFVQLFAQRYPSFPSLTRRSELNEAAYQMIGKNPLLGVGLNTFTAELETYAPNRELVRFIQPVHHIGLLWLAETGILGIFFVWILILLLQRSWSKKDKRFFFGGSLLLLVIGALDHYLLTLQTGILSAIFFILLMVFVANDLGESQADTQPRKTGTRLPLRSNRPTRK